MFCDYGEIANRELWQMPFYFATGLGHQAVMVFFVLSGFFVGGSVLRNRQNFSWKNYSIARLSRLWTVLFPALVFTAIVDFCVANISPSTLQGSYYELWNSGPKAGNYDAGIITFLCNVFFLQTVISPVYGTNSPLWSLANEFWYYALFPLLVAAFCTSKRYLSFAFLIVALTIMLWLPRGLVFDGAIWIFGAAVYWIVSRYSFNSKMLILFAIFATGSLFLASIVDSKFHILSRHLPSFLSNDLLVGISFATFSYFLAIMPAKPIPIVETSVRWLSDVSYSLYLFHFPIIILIASIFHRNQQFQPDASSMFFYILWLTLIILSSHCAWWLFERNTDFIRKTLVSRLQWARN